jgi:hypothetical protein
VSVDETTVRAVLRAWTVPGPVPEYHLVWKNRLRRDWPALAKALDDLAAPQQIFLEDTRP